LLPEHTYLGLDSKDSHNKPRLVVVIVVVVVVVLYDLEEEKGYDGFVVLIPTKLHFLIEKVGILSGGERNRVQLAKLLKAGGNCVILDEPSNDLDVRKTCDDGEVAPDVSILIFSLVAV
jgi:ABC-type glutathione transport system ATPase component